MRARPLLAWVLGSLALAAAGCGGDQTNESGSSTGASGPAGSGGGASSASSSGGGGGSGGATGWRSTLYPDDWTPAFTGAEGHFLHDFSYAGYHNGAAEPEAPAGAMVLDVAATYGADPTGVADATAAVQLAISDAEMLGGAVVMLPEGLYRFDGTLVVGGSGVVIRGAGADKTKLYFTKTQGMSYASHLRFAGDGAVSLEVPLAADAVPREASVAVDDPGDLAAGDDVEIGWVITPEFIEEHGMTGTWQAFNDTWQPFFRRTVVAVDETVSPPRVVLDVPIRYPAKTRDLASVRRVTGLLRECGVESLGVSNAVDWDEAWTITQSHAIEMYRVKDCWVRDVASFSSPLAPSSGPGAGAHVQSGGILVTESKRVSVANTQIGLAENRGDGGNGYLFEVRQSGEVLFRDSVADGGRHNFIQNWGFGTTGCVWLRVESRHGVAMLSKTDTLNLTGLSEFHHSLATANLIDSSTFDDGWSIVNRNLESTGAGHTGTQNAMWNLDGAGMVRSLQFGVGYLIGTQGLFPVTESPLPMGVGTAPIDHVEGLDQGGTLTPSSLYEDQLARRLGQ